jgi:hypothetical protein
MIEAHMIEFVDNVTQTMNVLTEALNSFVDAVVIACAEVDEPILKPSVRPVWIESPEREGRAYQQGVRHSKARGVGPRTAFNTTPVSSACQTRKGSFCMIHIHRPMRRDGLAIGRAARLSVQLNRTLNIAIIPPALRFSYIGRLLPS